MSAHFDIGVRCRYFLPLKGGGVEVEEDRFLGVRGAKISAVAPWKPEFQDQSRKFIDARKHVVLPGLVNAHTHLAMTLFRGFEDDVPFRQWLFERILPLENALVDEDFVRTGTLLGAAESIRFGVTTVNDMYFHASAAAETLRDAGLRALVAQVWSNFPLPEDKTLGSDKNKLFEEFLSRFGNHELITPALGPHAPYSCDDATLKTVVEWQKKTGARIHIHVSETKQEVSDSLRNFGFSPVQRLARLGALNPKTICAHMVHLDEEDRATLKESGAAVAYNPDSNLKLGAGIAPIADYLRSRVPVALGTDGAASNNNLNLFGAMNLGTKLQKTASGSEPSMTAAQALLAATWEGARALGLEKRIGSLEEGKAADFIAVNFDHPHLQPINDIISHLAYAATGLEVDHVACHGKLLLENGRHTELQLRDVFGDAERWRQKIRRNFLKMKS